MPTPLTSDIGAAALSKKPRKSITQRQQELRARLWPDIGDGHVWRRKHHDGFTTIPRTMPLIIDILNDMAGGNPVGTTYLDLWCRAFDECFVTLSKPREMAFHAGFSGQRGERTWRSRMRILEDLRFIDLKEGASGPMSYALIFNPYLVIRRHHQQKHPGLREDKYNALVDRAIEIGAKDFDMPDPWASAGAVAPVSPTPKKEAKAKV